MLEKCSLVLEKRSRCAVLSKNGVWDVVAVFLWDTVLHKLHARLAVRSFARSKWTARGRIWCKLHILLCLPVINLVQQGNPDVFFKCGERSLSTLKSLLVVNVRFEIYISSEAQDLNYFVGSFLTSFSSVASLFTMTTMLSWYWVT